MNNRFKKQPVDPNRKPEKSITWVRNLVKIQNDKRVVVRVPKPALVPKQPK